MISWIQQTFQKHFKVVFTLLLLVMVLSLVFVYSSSGGMRRGDHETRTVSVFGVTLNSQQDQRVLADGQVSLQLKFGPMLYYMQQIDPKGYSYYRAAALHIADNLGLPQPTKEDLKEFVPSLRLFTGQDGKFDPQKYQTIVDNVQAGPGDRGQFSRVLADDWRVAQVERLVGGPGYVLDSELKQLLTQADTKWSVQLATLDLSKMPPPREPTEDELRQAYNASPANYQIPERTRVKYVEFTAEEFAPKVGLSDGNIKQYFEANKSRYRDPAPPAVEGQPAPAPVEPTLEAVYEKVKADLTRMRASQLAMEAASKFAEDVYTATKEGAVTTDETFTAVANAQHLVVKSPEPFTFEQAPAGTGWNANILRTATTQLNDKRPVTDTPLTNGSNALVLFFVERLPAFVPDFAVVRDRVAAAVKEDLRRRAISARGAELQHQLQDAIKNGTSFADAAKAAGLEVKSWENFTLRNRPQDLDYDVLNSLDELKVNEVSPMSVQEAHGKLMLLTSRQVPEVASSGDAFEQIRRRMMEQMSNVSASDSLDELVRKGFESAGVSLSALR